MNVRRKIVGVLLLVAVLLSAIGCHGARDMSGFAVPESFDESKNYEITFWAKNDTNKNQVNVYTKAAEDFMKLYPNVKVTIKFYTDYTAIYQDVINNISTQTTPNVCISYPDHVATYLTGNGVMVPLDDLMADAKYGLGGSELRFDGPKAEEIVPTFLEEGKLSGKYYLLPYMRSTEACYINKTYVEKLGYTVPDILTWDFIFEVSRKAAEKDADGNFLLNGDSTMIPFLYKSTDNMMIQMLKQFGGDYSKENGEILIFNDTTKSILRKIADATACASFSTFKISGYPANFLNAGQAVFAVDSTAGSTWMGSDAPLSDIGKDRTVDFEIAVRPVPQVDPGHPQMISQGPSVCIFNKQDNNEVLASWLFAQFLLTNDVQLGYSETEGYLPVTLKAQQSEEYLNYLALAGSDNEEHYSVKIDAVRMLQANQENTFTTPVFNGSTALREAAGDMIERVTKSVRRKETVDDAYFEKLYTDVPQRFHLNEQ